MSALPELHGMSWRHQQSCPSIENFEGHYKECLNPHDIPHSRCIDIVMICEIYNGEVCYLFYFKFFCDTTFNYCHIANHFSVRENKKKDNGRIKSAHICIDESCTSLRFTEYIIHELVFSVLCVDA
jgi:hypothetical protein